MPRPKGSKNKVVEQVVAPVSLDVDKHNNILRGGAKVGTIAYQDGLFVATVGSQRFGGFTLEDALDKASEVL